MLHLLLKDGSLHVPPHNLFPQNASSAVDVNESGKRSAGTNRRIMLSRVAAVIVTSGASAADLVTATLAGSRGASKCRALVGALLYADI
jgi:hypothetical protein